jgi:hypothetical protein
MRDIAPIIPGPHRIGRDPPVRREKASAAPSTTSPTGRALRGALYRHFASKDDLVWQVFEKHYVA